MTCYVYVIVSLQSGRFYVGQTDNLLLRYKRHASGTVHSTKHLLPHVVGHVEEYPSRKDAMRREKQLKEHAGRAWISACVLPLVREWYAVAQW